MVMYPIWLDICQEGLVEIRVPADLSTGPLNVMVHIRLTPPVVVVERMHLEFFGSSGWEIQPTWNTGWWCASRMNASRWSRLVALKAARTKGTAANLRR